MKSLLRREAGMAESLIARVKLRPEGVLLNGRPVHTDARPAAGDVLRVQVGDAGERNGAEPLPFPLEFVYEDEDLAVLNKPADMAVHGSPAGGRCTVANALAALWGPEQAFHPVNRLDRGTSGLMVVAKSGYIHDRLRRLLHTDEFRREYLAAAEGAVAPPRGCIDLPLAPDPAHPTRRVADPAGLPSRTEYETLGTADGLTLLRVRPLTGRTHQIRAHFAALGWPLTGDALYGARDLTLGRPALHSARLTLRQPVTGELLRLAAPIPADMKGLFIGTAGAFYPEKVEKGPPAMIR